MVGITMWQVAQASLLSVALLQTSATAQITEDSYFYGQSPPVYPSPPAPGKGSWASAHAKAVAMVNKMTLAEKANLTTGYSPADTGCAGMTGSVHRLGFPGMCLHDSGNGVHNEDLVNAWPGGLSVGASWNKDLANQRALRMGGEFKKKGVNVCLGPVVGPIGRIASSGRTWEGFGADPYLSGAMGYEFVMGIQQAGVTATIKHFIGNEQETDRMPAGTVASTSSNIDDKTMHELYLWPFQDALHAGVGSVMCAYTSVNNSYSCQNSKILNGLLKTELGFEGFVVSDWGAQYAGVASTLAGMDLAMPNSLSLYGANGALVTQSVNNGSVTEARVSDMAVRLIATWYQMGQDSNFPAPGYGMGIPASIILFGTNFYSPQKHVNARDPASKPYLLAGAMEGHVLVKNTNHSLPLKKPQLISVFGYDAPAPATVNVGGPIDLLGGSFPDGYESLLGYIPFLSPAPLPDYAPDGTIISGGGSGANSPAYISAPFDAIKEQAYEDGTSVFWDFANQAPIVDSGSDACLVFINNFASEGYDRVNLSDDYSDTLVNNVADSCANTIVTIHNPGIRLVENFIDHPNVTAVIYAHVPGQDSGRALVQLLYGQQSFSGKLPYTVAKSTSDYINGGQPVPTPSDGDFINYPQANFSEGVLIDYKGFDAKNVTPRFEFGYGLSYTTFSYSRLDIDLVSGVSTSTLPPSGTIVQGGLSSLWQVIAKVSCTIKNSGQVDAMEVAQLYIGIPGGPVRQLRGFVKVSVDAGDDEDVEFDLTRRDLSEWDVTAQSWVLQKGTYNVYVGASSRDIRLTGTLKITN